MVDRRRAKEFLYDVRLQARHLTGKLISPTELEEHLANLPDLKPETDTLNVEQLSAAASARRRRRDDTE